MPLIISDLSAQAPDTTLHLEQCAWCAYVHLMRSDGVQIEGRFAACQRQLQAGSTHHIKAVRPLAGMLQ
jgi:hypothetical protein